MRHCLLAILILTCFACGNNTTGQDQKDSRKEDAVHAGADAVTGFAKGDPFVLSGCYTMTQKQDTALLSLRVEDTLVSGDLSYQWHARDANKGTLKGVLRDSLILADYTFESEGLTSVREVIFKIKDSTLIQAFGELVPNAKKVTFRDPNNLQYLERTPFIKTACDQ